MASQRYDVTPIALVVRMIPPSQAMIPIIQ